ncbi:MAG: hypothetical protein J7L14_03785 [Candidatus Diapherotrites archaeon]|nr:hypothetical protein [Candidatus Diapherotrites archaeon]
MTDYASLPDSYFFDWPFTGEDSAGWPTAFDGAGAPDIPQPSARELYDTGWPWPLDGVQEWFEALWNHVQGWISEAVGAVVTSLTNAIRSILGSAYGVLNWLWTWLGDQFTAAARWISDAAQSAVQSIWVHLQSIWDRISGAFDALKSWGIQRITGVIEWIGEKAGEVRDWVVSHAQAILAWLSDAKAWLWDHITWLAKKLDEVGPYVVAAQNPILSLILSKVDTDLPGKVDDASRKLWSALDGMGATWAEKLGDIGDWLKEHAWEPLKAFLLWLWDQLKELSGKLVDLVGDAKDWLVDKIRPLFQGAISELQEASKMHSPPPEYQQMATGLLLQMHDLINRTLEQYAGSPMSETAAVGAATSLGVTMFAVSLLGSLGALAIDLPHPFKDVKATEFWRTTLQLLGVPALVSLPILTPVMTALQRPLQRFYLERFRPNVPGISDLVRFVVRDVWNPDIVTPAPEQFKSWARKLGYDDFWADAYWTAHWQIPTYEQAREMWWRGKISFDDFMQMVHLADYHPRYDDWWRELSQKLPGRIDARWMYEWGIITEDDLKRLIRAEGIHTDWVDKVKDAYVKNVLRDEIGRVRSALERLYREGFIDEGKLRDELRRLGFIDPVIELTVKWAQLDYELDYKRDLVDAAIQAFRKDVITEEELRQDLLDIGLSEERADAIVKLEKFRKLPKPKAS